jgi:MFS transporter
MRDGRAGRVGYAEAFGSGEFRALLAAQLVSIAGTSIAAVVLTVVVYRRTASPLLASLTFALGFLPYLLGGGLLSSLVDRVRPRRLLAVSNGFSALLAAAMAWPGLPVAVLLALIFGVGTLSSVSGGARVALVRSTVSDDAYVPARSLLRVASQLAQIGGNALGGVALVALSPSGALLLNAASFVFAAAAIRFGVRDRADVVEVGEASLVRDSLRGAGVVFAQPELRRLLLLSWLAPMFAVAPEAVAAPYVAAHHGSAKAVGWFLLALPLGIIAGDVAGVRLLTAQRQRLLVAPAAAAGFVPYLAFGLDPPVRLALLLLAGAGACGLYTLGLDARIRDAAGPRLFARTMTIGSAGQMTTQGLGFALAGAIAQGIGPARAIWVAGACGVTTTVALLRADLRASWTRAFGEAGRSGALSRRERDEDEGDDQDERHQNRADGAERRFAASPAQHGGRDDGAEHRHREQRGEEAAPAESAVGRGDGEVPGEQRTDDQREDDVDAAGEQPAHA